MLETNRLTPKIKDTYFVGIRRSDAAKRYIHEIVVSEYFYYIQRCLTGASEGLEPDFTRFDF